MNLSFSPEDELFRAEIRDWLSANMADFQHLKYRGGPGDMDAFVEERRVWEHRLAEGRWTCLTWPEEHGGRGASLYQEVIFHEEYARAGAPGRLGHIGETLLGPTVIEFGTELQKKRFLEPIRSGTELWCQGYSEPNAGSDLANVQTRAEPDGDGGYRLYGQKVWTSLATFSDWCFALVRTNPDAPKHKGISCVLVPMDQPGVEIVPIKQMTGSSEFCEVFFDGAVASEVVGPVDGGWKVAMHTLAHERGASTLGQQLLYAAELDRIIALAKDNGAAQDPILRDRIAGIWMRLQVMRHTALRTLSAHNAGELPREAYVTKLYWSHWHRDLGELAMDVLGDEALVEHEELTRLFLWSRCDTIYAGTSQIQRNLIAQRALGMPRK